MMGEFLKAFTLMLVGQILSIIVDVENRDKASSRSPKKFSIRFFFKDNKQRLIISFIFSLALLVGYKLISFDVFITHKFNNELTPIITKLVYLGIGLVPDFFVSMLKNTIRLLRPTKIENDGEIYFRKEKDAQ